MYRTRGMYEKKLDSYFSIAYKVILFEIVLLFDNGSVLCDSFTRAFVSQQLR